MHLQEEIVSGTTHMWLLPLNNMNYCHRLYSYPMVTRLPGLVLSLWRKALVRVTAAPPSYVFPLLELSDYSDYGLLHAAGRAMCKPITKLS